MTTGNYVLSESINPEEIATISLLDWVLHEHTLLGLCFAKENSPSIDAGCCCVCGDVLKPRHRVWIFLFVLVATIFVSVEASLEMHGGFWKFCITTFVLMPVTCMMKSCITRLSLQANEAWGKFGQNFPLPLGYVLGAEDVALFFFGIGCVYHLFAEGEREGTSGSVISAALGLAVRSWAAQMVFEVPSLIWKYFFCRFCCCCCCCWQDAQGDTRSLSDLHAEQQRKETQQPILNPAAATASAV